MFLLRDFTEQIRVVGGSRLSSLDVWNERTLTDFLLSQFLSFLEESVRFLVLPLLVLLVHQLHVVNGGPYYL